MAVIAWLVFLGAAASAQVETPGQSDAAEIEILYLEHRQPRPATLSNLDAPPEDDGLQGARLGLADNNTTGRFFDQSYRLREVIVPANGDFLAAARQALKEKPTPFIVANLPAGELLALADLPEAKDALIFNAGAGDTRLRDAECRANVLHTAPSRAMLADSLMQFLIKKQWTDILLIEGPRSEDQLFAEAIRNSAKKFRTRIVADKKWTFGPDMRRSASAEVPLFTQVDDYDVVVVADEVGDFGQYLLYNTWLPRPVAGSHGLMPVAWHRVVEQWGAVQLQNQFRELAGRDMRARDYAAWAGVRAVGEAAARINSGDPQKLAAYIRSPDFKLALFKGRALDFRPWSGQLRQPVPLVHRGALVALAPFEGFLHQNTDLDTIGIDQPETKCQLN